MTTITADRLSRIHDECLTRLTPHFPDARFLDDTEIILDATTGATADISRLLGMIEDNDDAVEDEVIDYYWGTLLGPVREATGNPDGLRLDRRRVLATVTKVVHRIDALPGDVDGFPFTEDLMFVYALRENDAIRLLPLRQLTELVDLEVLDAAANATIEAYSRGPEVLREMGGVMVRGLKQTPSIALLVDACRKNLQLDPCEHGYFVSMPTREHVFIVPATQASMFLALIECTAGTFSGSKEPLSPSIFHVQQGHFHEVIGPRGVQLNDVLLDLHGPIEEWPLEENYWDGCYAAELGDPLHP
ncbi:hypothetical protein [Corynebacterium sp.]|uniref:hypothetical protein n=1 Tax=Corynebacterium sp. TaxID=1720 RepID=UPI0026DF7329|nr:hypothetical protein [Corynebacterium sp.]MDO5511644.1 hypothetical protein [Corynebacterium sp.]